MRLRVFLGLTFAVSTASLSAQAADWFVETGAQGDGTSADPFGTIQAGLDAAQPGDSVVVAAGTYEESLQTQRDGSDGASISLIAEPGAEVVVTASGRVLRVDHAYFTVEGIVFDGQYGDRDVIDVNDPADGFTLRHSEVRDSGRDCVDMGAPSGVRIDGCAIHHCLDSREGRTDAHGVTGGAVRDLTIRNTEIHTFSGDGVQFDPGREQPGWDGMTIEGCRIWLEPLPQAENGFDAGVVPGENAVDTKTNADAPRASLTISNTDAWGFRNGLISNMAAFNLKEKIDVLIDGVTVHDSEIAFRLRGPGSRPGAWVRLQNAVVYDVDVGVRYEDDIENLRVYHATFGLDVGSAFMEASADNSVLDVRNVLLLGSALPPEAPSAGINSIADESAFVTAALGDYHLADGAAAIDAGEEIDGVARDRDGVTRPMGDGVDVGAYEWCAEGQCGGMGGAAGGTGGTAAGGTAGAALGGAAGQGGAPSGGSGGGNGGGAGTAGTASTTNGASDDGGDDGGCGCRIGSRSSSTAAWALVAVVGSILARRRRGTRRHYFRSKPAHM